MGNLLIKESKQYEIHNGILFKAVGIDDIVIPQSRILPKYTNIIGNEGVFALFEDLSAIDLGDIIDASSDDVNTTAFGHLVEKFMHHDQPVVISLSDSDAPIMISNHSLALIKRSDDEIHRMRKITCIGFLLEHDGKDRRIERLGQGINILDVPPEISASVIDREVSKGGIDMIVSGHEVKASINDYIVDEGVFDIYLMEQDSIWYLSLSSTDASNIPIKVKASVICWRPTPSREVLLSQLKPFLLQE